QNVQNRARRAPAAVGGETSFLPVDGHANDAKVTSLRPSSYDATAGQTFSDPWHPCLFIYPFVDPFSLEGGPRRQKVGMRVKAGSSVFKRLRRPLTLTLSRKGRGNDFVPSRSLIAVVILLAG